MHRVRSRGLRNPPPRKDQLAFKPLTPAILQQEIRAIIAGGVDPESVKRATSRLNRYLASGPGEDADLAVML